MLQHTVMLDGETDWLGFRREARAFLAHLVPPESIGWRTRPGSSTERMADAGMLAAHADSAGGMNPVVPRSFMTLCETVVLHDDPGRFGLLYRLLWRLVHEPDLRHDLLDADRVRAQHMAQAVRRDMHKMKADMRFRAIDDGDAAGPLHAAWFEPAHHIVEAAAPFFMRRFAQTRWAVLTPERSMRWNGETLEFGPGGRCDRAPLEDDGEASWLACYRGIFDSSQRGPSTRRVVPAER